MAAKRLITVCGATGQQGGSVVRSLLAHGGYSIRGLTRDPTSASSRALSQQGVEMVSATPEDLPSLQKAFKGAYAVFGMTVSHTQVSETDMGRNMVDACKDNGVPLFVWSSLPSARETSAGKHSARGFDEKAEVDKYIAASGQPSVILRTGGFAENLSRQLKRSKEDPNKWEIQYPFADPELVLSCTWVEHDVGPSVLAVIEKWEDEQWRKELTKDKIAMCSWRITGREMAEVITRVTGKETVYMKMDTAFPPTIPLFKWQADGYYTYDGAIPPEILVKAGVQFGTFEQFVREKVPGIMAAAGPA